MAMIDWTPLHQELTIWRHEKRDLPIWWRDDDAIEATGALDQLAKLAEDLKIPVHLAVIPKHADQTLADRVKGTEMLIPLVHGWQHANHAPQGLKKAEFGNPRTGAKDELATGLQTLTSLLGDALVPIFVPPWNRIDPTLIADLPNLGYKGISTYNPRPYPFAAPDLVQINTHIDPIDWRGTRSLVEPDRLIATLVETLSNRRLGHTDQVEPLGMLTHHLVHDEAIWSFTRDCLAILLDAGARAVSLRHQKEFNT